MSLLAKQSTEGDTEVYKFQDVKSKRRESRKTISVMASVRQDSFGFEPKRERQRYGKEIEGKSAFDRIEWASKSYPGHVAMSTSFGIDSAVLLHLASTLIPDIPVIYVDTGFAPPETYQYVCFPSPPSLSLYLSVIPSTHYKHTQTHTLSPTDTHKHFRKSLI